MYLRRRWTAAALAAAPVLYLVVDTASSRHP